jgi:hypothetical protein
VAFSISYFVLSVSDAMASSFSADDEPINIILHVPSTRERKDYDQPGNVMLLTRYAKLNSTSDALCNLYAVTRKHT